MAGLPKLPGFNFVDPTSTRHHLSHVFDYCNGYQLQKTGMPGPGGQELDANSVAYISKYDPVRFDPSLTYGRTRSVALPQFTPHYALYDKKCLFFDAFFKQSVNESPLEYYRVRKVNIIYFLEDDTMLVSEPRVLNSGLNQGKLVKRGKIPRNQFGECYDWKDLQVGKDFEFYGVVYHTVDCDTFTREFMRSQGLIMADREEMPPDLYTQFRESQNQTHQRTTPTNDDKMRRFLEYDGKVLSFDAVWDTRDEELGELRKYKILYFLADDTIAVKELHEPNDGRDPFPLLLKKRKLPKVWTDKPVTYPAVYMELSDAEVTEYYQPKDLQIGETIFILGRRMLLINCDKFTRNYFRNALCLEQGNPINIEEKTKVKPIIPMPPHDGIGSLEDSLQNTISFLPKPPRKDVIRQLLNANKYLRYIMKIDAVHPEDTVRRFLLRYSLSDGTCYIYEPPIRNSGILGGKYLKNSYLIKPASDPLNPDYYTPVDFYIGAVIIVHSQKFIIVDADLYVYRYMQANPEKFPCEVIENVRNHMYNRGYLNEDVKHQMEKEIQSTKKVERDAIGRDLEIPKTYLEKCFDKYKESTDIQYEKTKKQEILQEYEDSLKHTYIVPEHGILPVNKTCAIPVVIGTKPDLVCKEEDINADSFAPKHIDTPEEIQQKYYSQVLKKHHDVCNKKQPIVCDKPDGLTRIPPDEKISEPYEPIIVSAIEQPKSSCKSKTVRFEDDAKCQRDRYDLCNLKKGKTVCGCSQYEQNQCK